MPEKGSLRYETGQIFGIIARNLQNRDRDGHFRGKNAIIMAATMSDKFPLHFPSMFGRNLRLFALLFSKLRVFAGQKRRFE
jgi:hypothetical protein